MVSSIVGSASGSPSLRKHSKRWSQLIDVKGDINTTFTWMFGEEADPTNGGIAQEIETRFEEAERRRQLLEDRVDAIIDELHDAEDLDFERDDV
ncbi:hypothetical protein HPS36_14890 [Halorubrum salinarum]|uniref:Uncharacterized protein n=1 Tax=Halorubrum salinarum TaxID=2739057 RepID=A0A7D3Y1I9_9EURY|nr:hypothetical protein [Halorubrum salinarum]QKG94094.1 hypothetical protein HPS36_14890 [Halorubrum salinarum]